MQINFEDKTKQEVWNVLRALNDSWTKGDGSKLNEYFHLNMVAITPVDKNRRVGRDECIAGWVSFIKKTKVIEWKEIEPLIEVYDNTAIITYYYEMSCEINSRIVRLTGRDMFTFIKQEGRWWAVANQFSPYPEGTI